jgi:hypothetical protein
MRAGKGENEEWRRGEEGVREWEAKKLSRILSQNRLKIVLEIVSNWSPNCCQIRPQNHPQNHPQNRLNLVP